MTGTATLLTVEDLLALPENGTERALIRGELREAPMTRRNRFHSRIEATIARLLGNWLSQQPAPRGGVFSGEAGCILRRNPDTVVGIDVCYVAAAMLAQQSAATEMIEGPPVLAVEILSPNDQLQEIESKISEYLACGVKVVWAVNPYRQTVTVYRSDQPPQLFNITQTVASEPYLPGFQTPVAAIFEQS